MGGAKMAEDFDLSALIDQAKEILSTPEGEAQVQNLMGMLGQSAENQPPSPQADDNSPLGDVENIMKIKTLMEGISGNKNEPQANFLQALKPFLKKERRDKIDQAAKLLSISKALKMFKNLG